VGDYLFRRPKEIEVGTVFGVPNYDLALLDLIPTEGLARNGSSNELAVAYSADGFVRNKAFGVLVTTFSRGELNALCGIGGENCEFVPVLHIGGYPAVAAQKSGQIPNHTMGDGKYE
ncbi:uncharacterized protein BCR38DRAFT_336672, partial [Pseudomassariella vexata]